MPEIVVRAIESLAGLPMGLHVAFLALLAGMLGSFINVCIWRIPRGESIVLPRSRCVSCATVLTPLDLVPVLSYLAMRGRCRHCGAPVSARYLAVELSIITIWVGTFLARGPSVEFVLIAGGLSFAFTVTGIQVMRRRIRANARGGFTFISVLMAAMILGITVGAFLESTRTTYMGAMKNREHLLAVTLAQERMEELKAIPVRKLVSDRKIYIETEKIDDNIFRDEFFGDFAKMRESPEFFHQRFTDVYTEQAKLPEGVWERFCRNYARYYGFPYQPYPQDHGVFRRVTRVQDLTDKGDPDHVVKKVIVSVEIDSAITKGKRIELEQLFAEH